MHDSKRQRLVETPEDQTEHVHPPSLVVHVRGLPEGVTEGELRAAVGDFGPVACVLMISRKKQALVEFEDIDSAINCVEYSRSHSILVRNTCIYFNFSTSQRIIRPPFETKPEDTSEPNNVLLLTVMNPHYAISCDVMHAITHNIAQPVRCVIFRKNGVQSMIEFASISDAARVKQQLQGADIYSGCCTLKIEYAKPTKLNVFKNDIDNSWDWVTPNLEASRNTRSGSGLLPDPSFGSPTFGGASSGHSNYSNNQANQAPEPRRPHTASGYYGYSDYGPPNPYDQMAPPRRSRGYEEGPRWQRRGNGSPPNNNGKPHMEPGCVLLIYGLAEKWNCDKLFSILCMYGNVIRIKFLKSKEGSAMVQLARVDQIDNAIQALNGISVFGSRLSMHHSRQLYIEEFGGRPASLPDLTPAYKDYCKPPYSSLQRFSTPESAAKNRLQPPYPMLHFFNAPPNVSEERVVSMLTGCGAPPPMKIRLLQGKSDP